MKKLYIVAFSCLCLIHGLIAQEQSSQDESKKDAKTTPAETTEKALEKAEPAITIKGPDGIILEESADKYRMEKPVKRFSLEEDLDLDQKTPVVRSHVSNDEVDINPTYQTQNLFGRNQTYKHHQKHKSKVKTIAGSSNHRGGFFGISFRQSEFNDESMIMAGFRTGWIVNRSMGIGFEGHGVIPISRYTNVINNQDLALLGGYGGMFLEPILFSNQVIHVTFPVSAGAGWLGYADHWENESNTTGPPVMNGDGQLIDQDIFWYLEPGANLEVNVSRNFRMCFGVSKRFTEDFSLLNTSENAMERLNYFVTLKFGRF